jgi:hypothetical protein
VTGDTQRKNILPECEAAGCIGLDTNKFDSGSVLRYRMGWLIYKAVR